MDLREQFREHVGKSGAQADGGLFERMRQQRRDFVNADAAGKFARRFLFRREGIKKTGIKTGDELTAHKLWPIHLTLKKSFSGAGNSCILGAWKNPTRCVNSPRCKQPLTNDPSSMLTL
jgi:hypothetical protein